MKVVRRELWEKNIKLVVLYNGGKENDKKMRFLRRKLLKYFFFTLMFLSIANQGNKLIKVVRTWKYETINI